MKKFPFIAALFVLASGLQAYGQVAAESTSSTPYSSTSNAALDFYVYDNITIDYLGVFDPGGDSLTGPVTVSIYTNLQYGSGTLVSYTFEPDTIYTQVGNDVFAPITPITLTDPGYTYNGPFAIDTYFGNNPPNESTGTGQTLNTFSGAVAWGGEYSDNNPFNDGAPTGSNGVANTTFNAGTFYVGHIPEGGSPSLYLLLAGLCCFGAIFLSSRKKLANRA